MSSQRSDHRHKQRRFTTSGAIHLHLSIGFFQHTLSTVLPLFVLFQALTVVVDGGGLKMSSSVVHAPLLLPTFVHSTPIEVPKSRTTLQIKHPFHRSEPTSPTTMTTSSSEEERMKIVAENHPPPPSPITRRTKSDLSLIETNSWRNGKKKPSGRAASAPTHFRAPLWTFLLEPDVDEPHRKREREIEASRSRSSKNLGEHLDDTKGPTPRTVNSLLGRTSSGFATSGIKGAIKGARGDLKTMVASQFITKIVHDFGHNTLDSVFPSDKDESSGTDSSPPISPQFPPSPSRFFSPHSL